MLRAAYEIIASGLRVLLILAAFGLTSYALGESDVECDGSEDICVQGERPNDDDQPYEFCMVQRNDHEYCSGNSNGSSSNGSSEGGGIDYDNSYDPGGPEECKHFLMSGWSQAASDLYNQCVNNVMKKAALNKMAGEIQSGFNRACEKWNDRRSDDNRSIALEMANRVVASGTFAAICALPAAEFPPIAAGFGAACGTIGALHPEVLDLICS